MVKKLTISIPDDLHAELAKCRDRIAISSVCAEAIRKKIQEIRKYGLEAKKRFGLLSLEETMDMAYERGLEWASKNATLEELAYVCLDSKNIDEELAQELWDGPNTLYELDNHYHGFADFVSARGFIEDLLPDFDEEDEAEQRKRDQYWIDLAFSFLDGAVVVWKEIEKEAVAKLLGEFNYEGGTR